MTSLFLFIITLAGGLLQGLTGFGSLLLCLPLASLVMPIREAIPFVTLYAMTLNLLNCVILRRELRIRRLAVPLLATLPGIPLGILALKVTPAWALILLVGIMLTPFAMYSLMVTPVKRQLGWGWAMPVGLSAGFLGGATGACGPPFIVYVSMQPWPRDEIKGSLAAFFMICGLVILAGQEASGLITEPVLSLYATSVPGLLLGLALGTMAYNRLGERGYHRAMNLLLLAMGLFMVGRGLLSAVS